MTRWPVHGFFERHPLAADALLGAFVAAGSLFAVLTGAGPRHDARPADTVVVVATVLTFALIGLRRRYPLPVLAAATAGGCLTLMEGVPTPALLIAGWIAMCTVAYRTDRRTSWVAGAIGALVLFAGSLLSRLHSWTDPAVIGVFTWTFLAVAIGDGVRTRQAYVAAVEERARRAERTREEEARRRVVEERLRIARELHDVVAHHIALINVQAGVAAHVLRQRPDQAEEALAHVRRAARTVLDETSTLLGVLRRPEDPADSEPTRGLSRLAGLLDSMAAAGLHVESRQEGEARALPSAVDLAAFRIVQESLTNAQKHGRGDSARLCIAYRPGDVGIDVSNAAGAPHAPDGHGGHGLIGMRERATAVGGTLDTAYRDGRFELHACLPVETRP